MLRSTAIGRPQTCQRETGRYKDGHVYQITSHTARTSAEREKEATGVDQSTIGSLHTYHHSTTYFNSQTLNYNHPFSQPRHTPPSTGSIIFTTNVTRRTMAQALLLSSHGMRHRRHDVTDFGYGRETTGSARCLGLRDLPFCNMLAGVVELLDGQAHYFAPRYHICSFWQAFHQFRYAATTASNLDMMPKRPKLICIDQQCIASHRIALQTA